MFIYIENGTSYRTIVRFSSTMYIKNRRYSSELRGCGSLQPLCNLIGKCDEVGYFSYTYRYQQGVNRKE